MTISPRNPFYIMVWEFHVRDGMQPEFESIYGPEGDWARLFRRGEGYLGTEFAGDIKLTGRYLTIDFWESPTAYEKFRQAHAREYEALDKKCETLTKKELSHGSFQTRGASNLRFS